MVNKRMKEKDIKNLDIKSLNKGIEDKIIGVPLNLGANKSGSEFSAETLKKMYPQIFSEMKILNVERKDENFLEKKMKYKNTVFEAAKKTATEVNKIIKAGSRAITIGGDHSIALGSISGVSSEKKVGVIWIDAHADMNTDESTETGHIHGMPLALLQGLGNKDFVNCFYEGRKIESQNVIIIGARDVDKEEKNVVVKAGVKIIYFDEIIEKGLEKVLEEIKEYLKVENLHISFDIDSIDPKFAPGVSTPVKQGFSFEDIYSLFNFSFNNFVVPSIDIVELNPINDVDNRTIEFAKNLCEYILNKKY